MKIRFLLTRRGLTRSLLAAVIAASLQSASAIIAIPRDFPLESTNGDQLLGRDRLSELVSMYRNDVVLLANPEEAYARSIRETVGNPATREKLKNMATAGGSALTADSLAAATAALVRQSPAEAPVIMASAMDVLQESSKKVSTEDRYLVGRAAISGLPYELQNRPALIASIIGIAGRDMKHVAIADLVRRLRDFAIGDFPVGERDFKGGIAGNGPAGQSPTQALALDQALVDAGILSPYAANPEFLVLANNFAADQLEETFFSGDQGVINQGAIFNPGAAGSAGGSGNSGNQINPTPTPPPPPPPAS